MATQDDLYQIADELRAIASSGIRYTDHGYDRERYEQILKASARIVAAVEKTSADAQPPAEVIYRQYRDNLAHLSPLLCVEAVVLRQGKILLIQRRDDHRWALPGGLSEVGESAAQAAERELWEEAGLHGQAAQLLGMFDSRLWPARTRMQLCIAMFLFESDGQPGLHPAVSDTPSPFSETLDVGFFDEHALPELSQGHELRIPMAFQLARGEIAAPFFDR